MVDQTGQPHMTAGNCDDNTGKADHRSDRKVELAADHQQRHRNREDAELRGDLEEIHDALGAEQPAVARRHDKEGQDEHRASHSAKFRPRQKAAKPVHFAQPLIACRESSQSRFFLEQVRDGNCCRPELVTACPAWRGR